MLPSDQTKEAFGGDQKFIFSVTQSFARAKDAPGLFSHNQYAGLIIFTPSARFGLS